LDPSNVRPLFASMSVFLPSRAMPTAGRTAPTATHRRSALHVAKQCEARAPQVCAVAARNPPWQRSLLREILPAVYKSHRG
jgi:hypothetical protein